MLNEMYSQTNEIICIVVNVSSVKFSGDISAISRGYTCCQRAIEHPENKIITQSEPFENEVGPGELQSSV